MSRYIRTNDGKIFDLESKEISSIEYIDKNTAINEYKVECAFYTIYYYNGLKGHYLECDNKGGYSCDFIEEKDILKQADTIEELFMPNDLLVVGDDKNQMPIFIESIEYLKAWLYCHDIYKIKEFYIKNGNDFRCIAKMNEKGKLELI